MANWSVTNTFANSTTADATAVNQNFTDIINCSSDGTKDMSISALTCAGTATFNGNVSLGNASGDDLTVTASLASTINIKTTYSYDIGSATIGLRSIYLGSSDSAARSTRVIGATVASSWTMTLPTGVPASSKFILESDTSGNHSYSSRTDLNVVSKTTTYVATRADDVILCSGSAFTVTLPAASGSMKKFVFKKTDSSLANIITIARAGSDTIDGATSTTLNTQYESIEIVSDGTSAWNVIDRNYPTAWVTYTPTFTGFGTESNVNAVWRRIGDSLELSVVFTAGTTTAVEARISLPTGLTLASSAKIPTIMIAGPGYRLASGTANLNASLITAGNTYIQIGTNQGAALNTAANGNTLGTTEDFHFLATCPISGWN